MSGRALVVSIHDVTPLSRETVAAMMSDLADWGVRQMSLLVVPDYHECAPLLADPECCEWLRGLAAAGHEVVLHGFTHRRRRKRSEGMGKKLITRVYTADEGEFFDIGEEKALRKLTSGLGVLRKAGLPPTGFIAPAWLLSRGGEDAARAAGFLYTTRLGSLTHLPDERTLRSQSLVWSVRSGWRIAVSLWWNARLFKKLQANPLLRIGVHPPDFRVPRVWKQVERLVRSALDERVPMTYESYLKQWLRRR